MRKLLVICGPTATGKTKLALYIAKRFGGELVSADSRQVYKGMDIGTGKDLPENAKFKGYYLIDGVRLWGLDLVEPTQGFSVAQYIKFVQNTIRDIWKRNKLPILVGGTGFYIKGVIDGIETLEVPKNEKWRQIASRKSQDELYSILQKVDLPKAHSLNESDRKNPVRLIRAIEIAYWKLDLKVWKLKDENNFMHNAKVLYIGLTAPKEVLFAKIEERVEKRVHQGVEDEIKKLLKDGVTWEHQSMNTLGYREWRDYFNKEITKEEVIAKWKGDERQYGKRQMTWFKKDKRMQWFDITSPDFLQSVVKMIQTWHN